MKRTPYDKNQMTAAIYKTALMPLYYQADLDIAKQILKACYEAGIVVMEFTNRAAFAYDTFAPLNKWSKQNLPGMYLGIGTVIDAGTAAMYLQAGADFIVMPSLQPEVISLCNKRKVLCIPGCGTVSEISKAEELGCEIVKLFPGNHYSPKFISDLSGPMPWSSILVSGGVEPTKENIQGWLKAGATCLALGSKLFNKEVLSGKNLDQLQHALQNCINWVNELKENN